MSFENIISLTEVILTAIGLIMVVFGWIIPYYQNLKIEKKRKVEELELQKMRWEKEFIEEQISKLYGPISVLLQEQSILFEHILEMFGRRKVFMEDQCSIKDLTEDEQKIWMHYVNTYKIPSNNKVLEIIRNNRHLVYKSEMPESFFRYLDYSLGWELLDNQKRNDVPNYYEYYYRFNFPRDFAQYVNSTLLILQERKEELMSKTQ